MNNIDKKGFTLVEMMIVVLILGLVTAFLSNYLISEERKHEGYELQLRARNNVLSAINLIRHDLRILGSDPEFTGGFGFWKYDANGLLETCDSSMLFICDVNLDTAHLGDGIWDPRRETFGFYLANGETLKRPFVDINSVWFDDSSHALVNGITDLNFWYILEDGSVVTDPSAIDLEFIQACSVEVTGQTPRPLPGDTLPYTFTTQTRVTLRTRL